MANDNRGTVEIMTINLFFFFNLQTVRSSHTGMGGTAVSVRRPLG